MLLGTSANHLTRTFKITIAIRVEENPDRRKRLLLQIFTCRRPFKAGYPPPSAQHTYLRTTASVYTQMCVCLSRENKKRVLRINWTNWWSGMFFSKKWKSNLRILFFSFTIMPIHMVFVSTYVRIRVCLQIYIYMNHSARIISDYALVLVITHFSYWTHTHNIYIYTYPLNNISCYASFFFTFPCACTRVRTTAAMRFYL